MASFVMLMRDDNATGDWDSYIEKLIATGKFRGGSSLGRGISVRQKHSDAPAEITGMIRLEVENLEEAKAILEGNPSFEAGYAVELLEEIED